MSSSRSSFEWRREVGRKLRKRRRELDMSIEYVALISGTSQSHLSQIENGKGAPSLVVFVQICRILKTSPNEILNFVETAHAPTT